MDDKYHLVKLIIKAADKLFEEDDLMCFIPYNKTDENQKWYSNEEAVMFRFAHHFQNFLNCDDKFSKLHLDSNYNHDGMKPIIIPNCGKKRGIKPDIILHKRNSNEFNTLVIEMKMDNASSNAISKDRKKLKELTNIVGTYHYEIGILIIWGIKEDDTKFEVYEKGTLKEKFSLRELKRKEIK